MLYILGSIYSFYIYYTYTMHINNSYHNTNNKLEYKNKIMTRF